MRKCYIKGIGRDKSAYWEGFLGSQDTRAVFDFTYNKYAPKFDRFVPAGARVLEGGCGLGQYVYYYSKKGFRAVGVDFSKALIEKASSLNRDASFRVADINSLPFENDFFDVYILNGVLEHFEEGPRKVIKEAERVLKKGGRLIVTLQYINLARSFTDAAGFKREGGMKKYRGANIEGEYRLVDRFSVGNDPRFHSYFFNKKEAVDIFKDSGLEVIYTMPLSVENGLGDYKIFRRQGRPEKNRVLRDDSAHRENRVKKPSEPFIEWIKKTFIKEEPKDIVGRVFLSMLQACFGSMIMIVCRKK